MLRATAEAVLISAVERALAEPEPDLERVRSLLDTAARQHINLDTAGLEVALRQRLNAAVEQWARKPADLHLLEVAESVASVARVVPFDVNLWNSQNVYYELVQAVSAQARLRPGNGAEDLLERLAGMGERLGLAAPRLRLRRPASLMSNPRQTSRRMWWRAAGVAPDDSRGVLGLVAHIYTRWTVPHICPRLADVGVSARRPTSAKVRQMWGTPRYLQSDRETWATSQQTRLSNQPKTGVRPARPQVPPVFWSRPWSFLLGEQDRFARVRKPERIFSATFSTSLGPQNGSCLS